MDEIDKILEHSAVEYKVKMRKYEHCNWFDHSLIEFDNSMCSSYDLLIFSFLHSTCWQYVAEFHQFSSEATTENWWNSET